MEDAHQDHLCSGRNPGHRRRCCPKTYSEKIASTIDEEIKRIIDEQYARAIGILKDHLDQLHTIAQVLMEKEKITGDQFRALLDGKSKEEVFSKPADEAPVAPAQASEEAPSEEPAKDTPAETPAEAPAEESPAQPPENDA